ncbi:MAG: L,D-transpeptidase family protein [Alphaproteobacteria bacterium]|nr:L,D-transpeptidase family protein [Alphaproteobacteria bacterium]
MHEHLFNPGRFTVLRWRRAIACGAVLLGGASAAVYAWSAKAEMTGVAPAMVVPASLQPTDALPPIVAVPFTGDLELRNRLDATSALFVSGEKLHGDLLRQFYARHNFERVWPTRQTQADALLQTIMRAGEQGLDPDMFHAATLRTGAALSPLDRELLLSDAFLSYADALARGVLPIEERMDDEDLTPEPVDVAATLDNAIASPNPGAIIEALAPNSPNYVALRRALAAYRASSPTIPLDGARGAGVPRARPVERVDDSRLRQIIVNLERQRWLPRTLPADRIWVNIPDAHLTLYRDDKPTFMTRVVVGEVDRQTPELQSTITSLLFNPPWNIPPSIAKEEILPKIAAQPDYLARHHMQYRHNGAIQQLPGPGSALGQLKFEMANRFDVYLHDTPLKNLFGRDNRNQSHGCVRVQNPRELASLVSGIPVDTINKEIGTNATHRRMLGSSIPVFIVYQTAFAEADGRIEFRPDVYSRDDEIWQKLHPSAQAPVAEHELQGQRRG